MTGVESLPVQKIAPKADSMPDNAPSTDHPVLRTAKPEEGSSQGEFWAVLRALGLVVVGVIVLGYLFG